MRLIAVVAADRRGTIGRDGKLPWHLPRDLAHFKALTLGKPVLMGRRTWLSIGRPLPGRVNVVLSPTAAAPEGALLARSLDAALALPEVASAPEVAIIGGASLFREALPRCDAVYLTRVEAEVEGDTHLDFDPTGFTEVARESVPADARNRYAMTFLHYERGPCTR